MPITPAPEEVFTIAPPPPACISGISCFMHRNTPVRSTSTIRCHSSVESSASGVCDCSTPALLNATSSRPNVPTVWSSAARTSSSLVTSQVSASARPPSCSISRAVSRTSSSGVPATATAAPSAAKASAVARPMPLPAPVTKATLPGDRGPSVCVILVPPGSRTCGGESSVVGGDGYAVGRGRRTGPSVDVVQRTPPGPRSGAGRGRASAQGGGVDDEPVADVGGQDALVGLVDLVGGDDLDLGADTVLGAEVEHLLGQGDAADHRAGVGAATADERHGVEAQRLGGGADGGQRAGHRAAGQAAS